MRHALTQRVPRRGSFPAHRAAPCAPSRAAPEAGPLPHRGLCAHSGAGFFRRLHAGRRPQPINRPVVGRKGRATPQKAEDEKAPMAGRAADMGAYLCDVPDGARLFCTAPAGVGAAFPRTGARPAPAAPSRAAPEAGASAAQGALRAQRRRFLSAAACGKKAAAHKPPGGGAEGACHASEGGG